MRCWPRVAAIVACRSAWRVIARTYSAVATGRRIRPRAAADRRPARRRGPVALRAVDARRPVGRHHDAVLLLPAAVAQAFGPFAARAIRRDAMLLLLLVAAHRRRRPQPSSSCAVCLTAYHRARGVSVVRLVILPFWFPFTLGMLFGNFDVLFVAVLRPGAARGLPATCRITDDGSSRPGSPLAVATPDEAPSGASSASGCSARGRPELRRGEGRRARGPASAAELGRRAVDAVVGLARPRAEPAGRRDRPVGRLLHVLRASTVVRPPRRAKLVPRYRSRSRSASMRARSRRSSRSWLRGRCWCRRVSALARGRPAREPALGQPSRRSSCCR